MTGRTLSHYKILEKVGDGAMGVVYKAEDLSLRRVIALKFLSGQNLDAEDRERFSREAQAAASLDHPNICAVYGIEEAEGETFISMAYIEGPSLQEKLAQGVLELDEALRIAMGVGSGLQRAHESKIVHRDIKSANIMVTPEGEPKITDFGLALLSDRSKLTKSGTTLGTPLYMSPEQAMGQPTDRRSDCWSLGVVLYEMATGQLPFVGDYEQVILYEIVNGKHQPPTARRAGLPADLDRILGKALAKSPDERYQHVDDMVVDLRRLRKQRGSAATAGAVHAEPIVSSRTPPAAAAPAAIERAKPVSAPTRRIEHPPGGASREAGPSEVVISKAHLRLLWGLVAVSLAAALALAFARFG